MHGFHGQLVRSLATESIALEYLERAGPRIVRLRFRGSANLFAEVPDFTVATPMGVYHFWGGHRLWYAPEQMPRTYIPDDDGLNIQELQDGVVLVGKSEPGTGIQKSIAIRMLPERPGLTLQHTLVNHGDQVVELSPWSITQFRLGGIVIAPLPVEKSDADGLLPNRQFSLWPYTRIQDVRLHWHDDLILIEAHPGLPAFKIGYFNRHGWLAYWIDGILFQVRFAVRPDLLHPDGNCNAEIYCNDRFVELENLGPLYRLSPGDTLQAVEEWEIFDHLSQPFLQDVAERVEQLKSGAERDG